MIPERERAARPVAASVYFQSIKDPRVKRWNHLEADPELAGPWHQLFKQVQCPRHILSELLQDDQVVLLVWLPAHLETRVS